MISFSVKRKFTILVNKKNEHNAKKDIYAILRKRI